MQDEKTKLGSTVNKSASVCMSSDAGGGVDGRGYNKNVRFGVEEAPGEKRCEEGVN